MLFLAVSTLVPRRRERQCSSMVFRVPPCTIRPCQRVTYTVSDSHEPHNCRNPDWWTSGLEETNGGVVVFGGGLPLVSNGVLIGAVGVSGGTVAQDVQVATAGVAGLKPAA